MPITAMNIAIVIIKLTRMTTTSTTHDKRPTTTSTFHTVGQPDQLSTFPEAFWSRPFCLLPLTFQNVLSRADRRATCSTGGRSRGPADSDESSAG